MKGFILSFRSFRTKLTLILILAMFFSGALSNFIIYEYSLNSQLDQLRNNLMMLAQTAALLIDADKVLKIPLKEEGEQTEEYKGVAEKLLQIKKAAPALAYIYVLARTEKEGIFKFMIDIKSGSARAEKAAAYPGDEYDGSRFPALLEALNGPSADKEPVTDEWGVFLSAYAPIRDKTGNAMAILGVDMEASDIAFLQREVRKRAVFVLMLGILFAITAGMLVSGRVTDPIKKLVEGTRHISKGDLGYRVKLRGADEITELAGAFNRMAMSLSEARKELLGYFYRVVQSFVQILEAKDPYTKGHSDRVAKYAEAIAKKMGIAKDRLELLREAALLHDIGKLGIQDEILNKKTGLTDKERTAIEKHPAIGEEILKPVSLDDDMLAVVKEHHERYDGKGYPNLMSGKDINILAAIVAVADSFDAMTSDRAYSKALGKEEAMERLRKDSGIQFNPKVVEAFLQVLGETGPHK